MPPLLSKTATYLLCVAILAALGWYVRKPATEREAFYNADVAGITYNADLLMRGKVPLVDNLEYKAPGSFFMTWAVWKVWGRSLRTLERFGLVWSILAAVGIFLGGVLLFDSAAAGLIAGLLFTLIAPISDSLTVNYNSWMITAYVWATVLFIAGLRRGGWAWFLSAGVLISFAALLKRQAGVLGPLFPTLLLLAPRLERPSGWPAIDHRRALIAFMGGGLLGFVPVVLYYLITSGPAGVGALLDAFFFSPAGWRYAAAGEVDWEGKLERLEDGVLGFFRFMGLPVLLTAMTVAAARIGPMRAFGLRGTLLAGHLVLSILGLSLGFRFYMSYYLQALPAVAWLAVHSDGPLLRWFRAEDRPRRWNAALARSALVGGVLLLCVPVAAHDWGMLKRTMDRRNAFPRHERESQRLGAIIRKESKPSDTVWVWGRWAWPVYFHSQRTSCTRYYKVLGLITNSLDNTWRRGTKMTRFDGSGPWRQVGRELAACKPRFIVAARNESYAGFKPLEKLLKENYRRATSPRTGDLSLYRRRTLPAEPEPSRAPKPPKSESGPPKRKP